MLNQSEKYALVEHLKKNLDRCDNKSNEDIAKFCNEEFDFSRQDGRQIKIVAKHIENLYHILLNAGAEVWTKKEKKKTPSICVLMKKIADVENRVSDLERDRLTEIHAELDEGTFDGTRDQQENILRYSS
jgi:glutathione peroxidase-family protein